MKNIYILFITLYIKNWICNFFFCICFVYFYLYILKTTREDYAQKEEIVTIDCQMKNISLCNIFFDMKQSYNKMMIFRRIIDQDSFFYLWRYIPESNL